MASGEKCVNLNINQLAWPGMLVEVDVIAATPSP